MLQNSYKIQLEYNVSLTRYEEKNEKSTRLEWTNIL